MSRASVDAALGLIEAYNAADWTRLEAQLAPDSLYEEFGTGRKARGSDEISGLFQDWKQAMPDSDGAVTSAVDGGDTAVLEVTWDGTFTGPWGTPDGPVDPTGRHQTSRACLVFTFEGDRIKELHQYFDSMSLMQQLGMLEALASV
jgi:steroid delta-isomerase-like uncharacterized protein